MGRGESGGRRGSEEREGEEGFAMREERVAVREISKRKMMRYDEREPTDGLHFEEDGEYAAGKQGLEMLRDHV